MPVSGQSTLWAMHSGYPRSATWAQSARPANTDADAAEILIWLSTPRYISRTTFGAERHALPATAQRVWCVHCPPSPSSRVRNSRLLSRSGKAIEKNQDFLENDIAVVVPENVVA